jgi:hypothetical protein
MERGFRDENKEIKETCKLLDTRAFSGQTPRTPHSYNSLQTPFLKKSREMTKLFERVRQFFLERLRF